MPGDKCSVLGCGSCRRTKGIGIWKLSLLRTRLTKEGKKIGSTNLTKSRVVDAELKKKEKIENDKVFTSEEHFAGEDIEV